MTGKMKVLLPAAWVVGTIAALFATLDSLRTDSFDGLNNAWQIPFALPWFLIPNDLIVGHTQKAWLSAVEGLINAGLFAIWLRWREQITKKYGRCPFCNRCYGNLAANGMYRCYCGVERMVRRL